MAEGPAGVYKPAPGAAPPAPAPASSPPYDDLRAAAAQNLEAAQRFVDSGLSSAAHALRTGVQQGASVVNEGLTASAKYAGVGKAYVDEGLAQFQAVESQAFGQLKGAIELVAGSSPYVTYPALTLGALLVLPPTRLLLYRWTLGRLRSPDAVFKSSEGRVEGLRSTLEQYANESKKLQERMVAAEEEMERGMTKLKNTRVELQRLASVVAKSERTAAGVLQDLRSIKKVESAPQLRAEAASQLSSLRSQHSALQKYIYRIASKDV